MFDRLMTAQAQLVLVRQTDGTFKTAGSQPLWFEDVCADLDRDGGFEMVEAFPFLDVFLPEAETAWQDGQSGVAESDMWVESTSEGMPIHLRAMAIKIDDCSVLTIQPVDKIYRRLQSSLQRGRDELNEFRRKDQEHGYKETMLHCLVHDLVGSLSVAEVVFRTMQERDDLTPTEAESLVVGRNAMHSVSNQLRSMVDVFTAELKAVDYYETDPDFAPDILDCAMLELVNCAPAFRSKGVSVKNEMPEDAALRWPVVGEQNKLQRIIFNLLENALRHTPREGAIKVVITGDDNKVRLSVQDSGPGVPPEKQASIFARFSKAERGGGKGGLGLYFSRLMIERWGGEIGVENAVDGGALFWFELPRAREE